MTTEKDPDATTSAIVADLSAPNPATGKAIAEKHGVHPSTVSRVAKRYAIQITGTQKSCNPSPKQVRGDSFRARAVSVINTSLDLLTDAKLEKCSGPQLAVIAGILRDKVRDMDKAPEAGPNTVTARFASREDMMVFLKGPKAGPECPPPIEAEAKPTPPPAVDAPI